MTVYVDTSVVLRILLHESNPVAIWANGAKPIAVLCGAWRPLRTMDRLRLAHEISDTEVAVLVRDIQITHETFAVHPVTNRVFQRASGTFPTVVGNLDAIHWATALSIRAIENVELLLTHDSQFATAARSLGFEVMGVDQ